MQDFLTEITKSEKTAEKIINSAKKRASDIVESSQKEIEKQEKEILNDADKFVKKAIEEKRLLAQFDTKEINEECDKKIVALEETAKSNMDKAVSYILSVI